MRIDPKERTIQALNSEGDTENTDVKDTSLLQTISIIFVFIGVYVWAVKLVFF